MITAWCKFGDPARPLVRAALHLSRLLPQGLTAPRHAQLLVPACGQRRHICQTSRRRTPFVSPCIPRSVARELAQATDKSVGVTGQMASRIDCWRSGRVPSFRFGVRKHAARRPAPSRSQGGSSAGPGSDAARLVKWRYKKDRGPTPTSSVPRFLVSLGYIRLTTPTSLCHHEGLHCCCHCSHLRVGLSCSHLHGVQPVPVHYLVSF